MKKNFSYKMENNNKMKKDDMMISINYNKKSINNNKVICAKKAKKYKKKLIKSNNNNDKIYDSEQTDYKAPDYSKKGKKTINNIKIKYINNINNNIYSTEYRNNIDKPKEIFYTFRTGKFLDDSKDNNNIKDSLNDILNNKLYINQTINYNEKSKNKSKKEKNKILMDLKKNNKSKNKMLKNNNNSRKYSKGKYQKDNILFKIGEIINKKDIDKTNKKEKNKSFDLTRISLQSINDSKIFELAEKYIPKDEEYEMLKANYIINKKNNSKKNKIN
jgi:hypothetical protein